MTAPVVPRAPRGDRDAPRFLDDLLRWMTNLKQYVDGRFRSGEGTPEGAIAAPVGTLYTRTDGGAGTTLYVKESGTGSTGWAAK